MSLEFYKILHIVSLSIVLASLGGASFATFSAGGKPTALKKSFGMIHGLGTLVMFIAGFGMMAKMGIFSAIPSWIIVKIALWLVLGGWIAVVYKLAVKHPFWASFIPVLLVALASFVAVYKP
jgi:hypothetical protein